jgi:hypothetical protein
MVTLVSVSNSLAEVGTDWPVFRGVTQVRRHARRAARQKRAVRLLSAVGRICQSLSVTRPTPATEGPAFVSRCQSLWGQESRRSGTRDARWLPPIAGCVLIPDCQISKNGHTFRPRKAVKMCARLSRCTVNYPAPRVRASNPICDHESRRDSIFVRLTNSGIQC